MDAVTRRTYADTVAHGTKTAMPAVRRLLWISMVLLAAGAAARAADLTVQQISVVLAKASASSPADFSHRDLSYLDLSDLDFKHADLSGANLYGADLSRANLSAVKLAGANLDHTLIIAANFAGADLREVSLLDAVAFSTLEVSTAEAPSLAGARIIARLSRANMSGANLAHIHMGAPRNRTIPPTRNALSGCNLANASLAGADLGGVDLAFADLTGADLSHANLAHADLAHADLTGADLTGADLSDADLDETVLRRARGLSQAKGIDTARHHDTTIR